MALPNRAYTADYTHVGRAVQSGGQPRPGSAASIYRGQARAIDRYIRDMDREIQQCEEELKSKNRIIMSLGIAAGLFLVIVLL